jgi:NAD+ synthetase
LFVNAVGGNDDLIFDGSSAVFDVDGAMIARAPAFEESVLLCELGQAGAPIGAPLPPQSPSRLPDGSEAAAALDALTLGTRDFVQKCGFSRAVLGLSGGVDSALVAAIATRALGKDNVLALAMPTRFSSAGSLGDARAIACALGIELREIDIDGLYQRYLDVLEPPLEALAQRAGFIPAATDVTFENIQARIRGNLLMGISNRLGHLVLTTGNKSEIAVGYCTLYGDMAGALAVISDVPKTFVYEICKELNAREGRELIPASVLTKAPSAELREGQRDEDSLPPYAELDAVLERLVERALPIDAIVAQGFSRELCERVAKLVRGAEHKRRQMPPGLILTGKAFGPGRRYPIAAR